jgi:CubicO group peptidase (beta-lactamase class C family)
LVSAGLGRRRCHGQNRDKLHDTRSAAKSLTATIVGAAIQSGAPLELSTPVYEVMNGGRFPEDLEPRKRAMTLEHLLTMSSGFFCDDTDPAAPGNEEAMLDQTDEPDYYRFTLKIPMASAPGEKAVYCSVNPNLALGVVSRAMEESPLDIFDRLIGRPMKIDRYGWVLDPAGNPYGGGSVQLLPRDFMKLGQLMLDGGEWQGRRILGRDFVSRASAPQYHLRNIYYGYLWWGIDFPYKDRTVYAFFAGGAGGQGVIVVRELDLVVAVFAGNYGSRDAAIHIQHELLPRYILPAVREPGDDMSAPVKEREFVTPYGPSPYSGRVSGRKGLPGISQEAIRQAPADLRADRARRI